MTTDLLGVSREVKSQRELASSEYAAIRIGDAQKPSLIQSLTWNYNRQVQTIFEVGSSNIYFQGGRTAGDAALGRIIGKEGFYKFIESAQSNCGEIGNVSVQAKGGQCSLAADPSRGRLTFDSAIVTGVSGGLNAQDATMAENVTMLIAGLSVR